MKRLIENLHIGMKNVGLPFSRSSLGMEKGAPNMSLDFWTYHP